MVVVKLRIALKNFIYLNYNMILPYEQEVILYKVAIMVPDPIYLLSETS